MCFRVMGVITSDRKHFSNADPLGIGLRRYVCVRGGGRENWASSFQVIIGFLVVSLQFEPADERVLSHAARVVRACFLVYKSNSPPPH